MNGSLGMTVYSTPASGPAARLKKVLSAVPAEKTWARRWSSTMLAQ